MIKFIYISKIVGVSSHSYRVIQYEKDGEYYLFWNDKDILIGTFNKVQGFWRQLGGRQMPEEFPKQLGKHIEVNKLWI